MDNPVQAMWQGQVPQAAPPAASPTTPTALSVNETRVATLEGNLGRLEQKVKKLEGETQQAINDVCDRLTEAEKATDEQSEAIETLEEQAANQQKEIDGLKKQVDKLLKLVGKSAPAAKSSTKVPAARKGPAAVEADDVDAYLATTHDAATTPKVAKVKAPAKPAPAAADDGPGEDWEP